MTRICPGLKESLLSDLLFFPKYLFLFQTASLNVTQSLLNSWQRILTDFIWSFKKSCLPWRLLMASKALGGLAVPNLSLYYDAMILSTLLKHCNEEYTADWKVIEDHVFHGKSFIEVLWLTSKSRSLIYAPSPLCIASLKEWDRTRKFRLLQTRYSGPLWVKCGYPQAGIQPLLGPDGVAT